MVAAAKALADSARETKVLAIRGGIMQGRTVTAAEIETLATLPPLDVLRGQVLGAVIAPLTTFVALLNAPLQNLIGLIDARIEQLGGAPEAPAPAEEPAAAEAPAPAEETAEAEEPPAPADEVTEADATASAADDEEPTETEES
jgi:large subunit ribosomal protein L10